MLPGTGPYSAEWFIDAVADEGTWEWWDEPVAQRVGDPAYRESIARATERSGVDEAVLTGEARIGGHRVVLVVSEFGFLAGSIGHCAARRIIRAVERATAMRLPVIAAPASGGTRMQESTPAFVEMIQIASAVHRHKSATLPYLVYLRHPTTGGVLASWGSMGNITVAEPGALVGFLGPRVYATLTGEQFPPGVQQSDNLLDHGVIDAVMSPEEFRSLAVTVLDAVTVREPSAAPLEPSRDVPEVEAWDAVSLSRLPDRPGVVELLTHSAGPAIRLSGNNQGEVSQAIVVAVTSFGGIGCVVVGQDRHAQFPEPSLGPGDLRVARRGIQLADELGLPVVCVIDTPGATLSVEAEEGALSGEIARTTADLLATRAPSLSVLLGQGCGGGAIALLAGDRVIAAENSWLSPLPLEGASAIMYRDATHAREMAQDQGVWSTRLLADGIVDVVVPEGDSRDASELCRRIGQQIYDELRVMVHPPQSSRPPTPGTVPGHSHHSTKRHLPSF